MITIQFLSDFERISCVKIDTGKLTGHEKPTSLKAALMEMEIEFMNYLIIKILKEELFMMQKYLLMKMVMK